MRVPVAVAVGVVAAIIVLESCGAGDSSDPCYFSTVSDGQSRADSVMTDPGRTGPCETVIYYEPNSSWQARIRAIADRKSAQATSQSMRGPGGRAGAQAAVATADVLAGADTARRIDSVRVRRMVKRAK